MKANPGRSNVNLIDEIVKKYEESILILKNQLQKQKQKLQLFESISNLIPCAFFQFNADSGGKFNLDYISNYLSKF